MKKLNKVFYIVVSILQVLLLAGTYVVNYFTRKKMGMLRFVIYKNNKWENSYPIAQIQSLIIILFIVLMILTLVLYLKRKSQLNKNVLRANIVMVVIVSIYSGFNLLYSTEEFRAFYFMSGMLAVATFLQIAKTFFSVLLCFK